jgi:hypothetical protein
MVNVAPNNRISGGKILSSKPRKNANRAAAALRLAAQSSGTRLIPSLGQRLMNKTQVKASPSDARWHCKRFSQIHCSLWKNSRGGGDSAWIPRKSTACVAMIETAMPVVKPLVTGQGMNLMRVPMRAKPMAIRIPPAISVAKIRPEYPYFSMINRTIWYKRRSRTADLHAASPKAGDHQTAKIAVNNPIAGGG